MVLYDNKIFVFNLIQSPIAEMGIPGRHKEIAAFRAS
jgi:hypothetical protein